MAPCEISVSTSVNCCSALRFASALMYLPPAASTVFFMLGSSCAAQRGCWKLFHDTPTVQPAPRCGRRRRALRRWGGAAAAARTRGELRPRAPQRAPPVFEFIVVSSSKCVAIPSRNQRRCPARLPPSLPREHRRTRVASPTVVLAPRGPVAARPSCTRKLQWTPAGREPAGRIGEQRLERELRRTEQRGVDPEHRRDDADQPARGRRAPAGRARARAPAPTNGWIRPNRPPSTISSGLRMLTRPASPMPEPAADVVEGAQRRGRAGLGLVQHRVDLAATAVRSAGRPCAAAPPRRPRSPSSRPSRSGTATRPG